MSRPSNAGRRFPARLHVLLAREAPLGVVIRRGPARSVCTVLWDRKHDTFKLGQWMRGRIYERRCDLSPDGGHLIYFAYNFSRTRPGAPGSWTAISRAPYLKALVLWPKGDCWNGGGLFLDDRRYWLNGCHEQAVVSGGPRWVRDERFTPAGRVGAECLSVYYPRLQRDGWRPVRPGPAGNAGGVTVFEKPLRHGWRLRKRAHAEIGAAAGRGCYWDEHELEHPARGLRVPQPAWEWADLDGDRVVWAERGMLHAGRLDSSGLVAVRTLHDFNGMDFEAIAAPY